MPDPEDTIRRIITEESVVPRLNAHRKYLFPSPGADVVPLGRTELVYLWDEYGQEMLDFASLTRPLGHRHPAVLQAVREHLRYHLQCSPAGDFSMRWPVECAKMLSESLTPEGKEPYRVLYTSGGREAVRCAIDAAREKSSAWTVAVLDTGWHDWVPDSEIILPLEPDSLSSSRHAALLLSVVDTHGHVPGTLRDWFLAARSRGIPVIVDESVTGLGRMGHLWGQDLVGLRADYTVCGAIFGGGLPFGAVVADPARFPGDGWDVADPDSGNPVSCAAAAALFGFVGHGVVDHGIELRRVLVECLKQLQDQFPESISGHHGEGLIVGLRFRPGLAGRFSADCRSRGLYVCPAIGNTVVLAPPLIISTNEARRAVDLMAEVLISWSDSS